MPTIYDNISTPLLPTLRQTLSGSHRADICVGYFNLRGWASIHDLVENFDGTEDGRARVLIGMYQAPDEEMRRSLRLIRRPDVLDGPARARLQRQVAQSFREQLELGAPTDQDEATLRRVAKQIRTGRLQVKLFLRHTLHAKLYLGFRDDHATPILGYLGSSNLTASGLSKGGELNVDVLDQDACKKLKDWFEDRWNDTACLDISDELATLIETSWAREDIVPPYLVYLKMAYHLAQEAREGEREFKLPKEFRGQLLDFQAAAVSLAVKHINTRGGVLVGDVVGLGKTRIAAAIAKIYEEDQDASTLIICPKNLVSMWQQQIDLYNLKAEIVPLSKALAKLPELRRHKLVLIDESHNLRNRDGKRYQVVREYIERNDSRTVLLTATPFNKMYLDLGNQLRLFMDEKRDLGIRPERYFQTVNELDFTARFQAPARSLSAFEKSEYPEDWRDLMRLYMVRRTRQFIIQNYAAYDPEKDRYYVSIEGGRSYFPKRLPRNLTFELDDAAPNDQYARLYRDRVVDIINALSLPRYGLGNYVDEKTAKTGTAAEKRLLDDLGRAGPRLMGFCRTNLFKRLESSGYSFLLSLERHILRNLITLHAMETGQAIPIGTQESELLDSSRTDTDADSPEVSGSYEEYTKDTDDGTEAKLEIPVSPPTSIQSLTAYQERAAQVYDLYKTQFKTRFKWIRPTFFRQELMKALRQDAESLLALVQEAGIWNPQQDAKLAALQSLLSNSHPKEKVLIFTQFADTALYLDSQLRQRGIQNVAAATAQASDPTVLARRFSPRSNQHKFASGETELSVLVATDTLSEGQNLQDAAIVVQYDLPWAIIRMIQRAGRVDRIGQQSDTILVYSFLPAEGVERVIRLQHRLQQRLEANSEVVGSDESFFGETDESKLRDLYTERSGALEDEQDTEVDLSSAALQIWNNAVKADPTIRGKVESLPNVVYASKPHGAGRAEGPPGVMVYLKTEDGTDALVRMSTNQEVVTQSLSAILQAAQCTPDTPGLPRHPQHHTLVQAAVRHALEEEVLGTGTLGPPRSARRRAWERITAFREQLKKKPSLFVEMAELDACVLAIYNYRLTTRATEQINRMIRTGAHDADLIQLILSMHQEDRLSVIEEETEPQEPRILCSLGFFPAAECTGGGA